MIDVNKTYTISGQTLQDIIDCVRDHYYEDHGLIQVSDIAEALAYIQGTDWTHDFDTSFMSKDQTDIYLAFGVHQFLKHFYETEGREIGTQDFVANVRVHQNKLAYYIDSPETVYDMSNWAGNLFEGFKALRVVRMGDPGLSNGSFNGFFKGCTSLYDVEIRNARPQSAIQMFAGCKALRQAPALDLSGCDNTNDMFAGCKSLSSIPNYNLQSCHNTASMFRGTTCTDQNFLQQILRMCTTATSAGYKFLSLYQDQYSDVDMTLGLSVAQIDAIDTTTQAFSDFIAAGWDTTV